MTRGQEPAGSRTVDFLISYTGLDSEWAEWIAWHLEDAGYTTLFQKWDFGVGAHFVQEMDRAIREATRTIVVLSAAYLPSAYARAEWQAAWAADPYGNLRKLLVFRIEDCDRPGLLGQVVSVDLFGVSREDARPRLLNAVRGGRGKPTNEPSFPQSRSIREWNPFDLGVHRVIDVYSAGSTPSLPPLTPYIPRDHDRRLAELVAAPNESRMIVVVGGSSTAMPLTLVIWVICDRMSPCR